MTIKSSLSFLAILGICLIGAIAHKLGLGRIDDWANEMLNDL